MTLPERRNLTAAIAYLEADLTVTEGLWPKAVIDRLEDRYTGFQVGSRTFGEPRYMGVSYPQDNKINGLRWFYGWVR